MRRSHRSVLLVLVFGSGFCALVYQVAWFRLLRLVFGASTPASAAVLAVFMGGLGLGALVLGRWVDRRADPIRFYARLETAIAVLAAASPLLVLAVAALYRALGGTVALGELLAAGVRIGLAALVLGPPTFLMGGTLPALGRAVTGAEDSGRRHVGTLYAVNTVGAMLGVWITTFSWLEVLGTRRSLWIAALVNLLVAMGARLLARRVAPVPPEPRTPRPPAIEGVTEAGGRRAPLALLLGAAAIVGFAFFAMELVWYRLFSPLLGGTTYTFGIILVVALAGIGIGGWIYSRGSADRRPSLPGFAATCALEALALGVPLALGDRLAILALGLQDWGVFGFDGLVLGWMVFATVVIFPVALVAGYQFPLLVGLAGRGGERVGRQVGLVYAWNTVGAIVGSLAGGFGLLPVLSAPGTWRLILGLLVATAMIALAWGLTAGSWVRSVATMGVGLAALLCLGANGPTAYWRHSHIGAGRASMPESPNDFLREWNAENRNLLWEEEGRESGIGLSAMNGYSFIVNGKSDGNCVSDGPTQVMGPLVGSMLHEEPRRGLVIGLGTGSSAGWLADVPGMEAVDVVELEPAVLRVAETCALVNRNVLDNPRTAVILGDAREVLLTTDAAYDVIFSEPSNPYRAGISSLFTSEFYRAVRERLEPGGIFVQWLQAYEIDEEVARTVYATLGDVFPYVETWATQSSDLLLVAATEPIVHDPERVETRAHDAHYRAALAWGWGVEGAAGFYSGYVAGPELSRELTQGDVPRNTDDRPVIEYGFARSFGQPSHVGAAHIASLDRGRGRGYPAVVTDWLGGEQAILEQAANRLSFGGLLVPTDLYRRDADARLEARKIYASGESVDAVRIWLRQGEPPVAPADRLLITDGLAAIDHPEASSFLAVLLEEQPVAGHLIAAESAQAHGDPGAALEDLLAAFAAVDEDPFVLDRILSRALFLAEKLGRLDPAWATRLFEALARPLGAGTLDDERRRVRFALAVAREMEGCLDALREIEPYPAWNETLLRQRLNCYEVHEDPRVARARRDLERYVALRPRVLALPVTGGGG